MPDDRHGISVTTTIEPERSFDLQRRPGLNRFIIRPTLHSINAVIDGARQGRLIRRGLARRGSRGFPETPISRVIINCISDHRVPTNWDRRSNKARTRRRIFICYRRAGIDQRPKRIIIFLIVARLGNRTRLPISCTATLVP